MAGAQVIAIVLSWVVTTALSFLVIIVDERRLSEERLERAWPPASRDAALVAFGLLAVPIHFIRTRGHLASARGLLGFAVGLGLGLAALASVVLASELVLMGLFWVLGLPTD